MRNRYTVRQPISSSREHDKEGIVISRHRTLKGAIASFERRENAFHAVGGFSTDYIWDERDRVRVTGTWCGGMRAYIS